MTTVNVEDEEFRIKDGVEEHRHEDRDYWHPVARVHNTPMRQMPYRIDSIYDVNEDDVYDIVEALYGHQTYYVDLYGTPQDLPWLAKGVADLETLSPEWLRKVSEIRGISNLETQITYLSGEVWNVRLSSAYNGVEFIRGHAHYDPDTELHHAKLLIETGLAAKFIRYPDLGDAMHLLHVSGGDRYYDLIRLPSGGHIPVDILEEEYEVSWEILAKIPLGMPRDCESFTCPICGEKSYFAGVCSQCDDICADCEDWTCDEDAPCKCYADMWSRLQKVGELHDNRKEMEHGEILRLIKSGNWKQCRYMRG